MSTYLLSFGHFYVTFLIFLITSNTFQRVLYMISKIGTMELEEWNAIVTSTLESNEMYLMVPTYTTNY